MASRSTSDASASSTKSSTKTGAAKGAASKKAPPAPGKAKGAPGNTKRADPPAVASPHGGMGAVVVREGEAVVGVTFRVWAPNASAVRVTGTFSDWEGGPEMARENDAGYWSVHVDAARPGDEYKYVLDTPSGTLHRNDPYARAVTTSVGNSIVVDRDGFDWGDDRPVLGPEGTRSWNDLVVYELHVGTFFDADGNGLGTFDEAAQRLLWLRDAVGVTAIELMPVAEFAGDRSWGYNPAHPFAVEGAYGGPDGLKRFVRAAHALGIAVIVDVVYNHFGPSDLDIWQFDGWNEDGKGGIYFYNDARSETPWGDTRPDYGREEVRRYILDNARMWLSEYRVDGLRLDMVLYMRNRTAMPSDYDAIPEGWSMMQEINALVDRDFPGRITIAEDLQTEAAMVAEHEQGGAGFGAQWDAAFVHPVRAVLEAPTDAERSMHALAGAIGHRYGDDAFRRVVYTESHDEVANGKQRVASQVHETVSGGRSEDDTRAVSRSLAALGVALVATAPGIPMVFQGQETLMEGWFEDVSVHTVEADGSETVEVDDEAVPDQVVAAEMPNSDASDTLVPLGGATETGNPEAPVAFGSSLVGDLFRLRAGASAIGGLRAHEVTFLRIDDDAKVIAYLRHGGDAGDDAVVVLHFAEGAHDAYAVPMPGEGAWTCRYNSAAYAATFSHGHIGDIHAEPGDRDGFPAHAAVPLAPYGALVFARG